MRVRVTAAALFCFALMPALAAGAGPLSALTEPAGVPYLLIGDEQGTIQTIIRDQIAAFQRDDGETAYSYAAPSLKLFFPNPEGFMAMVRNGYKPIYRAKSFSFGELKEVDGKFVQSVEILGPDGDYWRALYTFVRQEDGSLKIVSCYLIKDATA